MLIGQISASDAVTQQVVTAVISKASVLRKAQFYKMVGSAEYRRTKSTATGGKTRAIGSAYAANPQAPTFANPALKIVGDKVQVDRAYERRGGDIASERALQLLSFAEDLGRKFQDLFFNGDAANDATQFDGIVKLMPAAQKITPNANGINVTLGNSDAAKATQQKLIELLQLLIKKIDGGAEVLYMNGTLWSRLSTIAASLITYQKNEFGLLIPYFAGVGIVDVGYSQTGADIITNTETCGNSNDCTSVYAARFGEATDLTLPTNLGLEVKDLGLIENNYEHSVEMDTAIALLNSKSIAKIEGIRIAS